jgi:hypothetical protein
MVCKKEKKKEKWKRKKKKRNDQKKKKSREKRHANKQTNKHTTMSAVCWKERAESIRFFFFSFRCCLYITLERVQKANHYAQARQRHPLPLLSWKPGLTCNAGWFPGARYP